MNLFLTLAFLFFIGSTFGWVLELFYRRFISSSNPERRWINPGFCTGPYLPIYGNGLCALYLLASLEGLLPWMNKFVMFLLMAAAMTGIEYVAGLCCLKIAKVRLWDYSDQWGNIQGIICPLFSLYWAIGGALYYFLIHPRILTALDWLSRNLAFSFFIGMFFGVFVIDFAHSANLIAKLKAFAEENDVVVRYEAVKLQVRRAQEKAKAKYHFFRPFDSEMPLHEHLKQMAATLEKRKSKTRKES